MRAGRLDRLITIQRKTVTQSDSGAVQETWADIVTRRPASISPVRGDERFNAPQTVANQQTEFRIRYSNDVANLNPGEYRIIYPALSADSPNESAIESRRYDILSVDEIGRREGLKIIAVRRPDALT